jgi:hypothetical protein
MRSFTGWTDSLLDRGCGAGLAGRRASATTDCPNGAPRCRSIQRVNGSTTPS